MPTENISRYLFNKKDLIRDKASGSVSVSSVAFEPYGEDNDVSVFKTQGLTEGENWAVGKIVEAARRVSGDPKSLKGRGDVERAEIDANGLDLVDDPGFHALHALIIGWPADEPRMLALAQKVAAKAVAIAIPP